MTIVAVAIAVTAIVLIRRSVVDNNPAHGGAAPQRDVGKPSESLDERAHERLHALLEREQRHGSPKPIFPLGIHAFQFFHSLWRSLGALLAPTGEPRWRAKLTPHDRPPPARLAFAQNGECGADAEETRIGRVYPVYERTSQRTRERVAEPSREERVDRLVAVVVIFVIIFVVFLRFHGARWR